MYTGYFSKLKKYTDANLTPVSITLWAPDWYKGLQYKKLAPKLEFFNEWKNGAHKGDNDYYVKEFTHQVIAKLDAFAVVSELEKMTGVDDSKIILLCYEKPKDFCHRHIVAKWLTMYSFDTKEFDS